jgi:hypothetical protein
VDTCAPEGACSEKVDGPSFDVRIFHNRLRLFIRAGETKVAGACLVLGLPPLLVLPPEALLERHGLEALIGIERAGATGALLADSEPTLGQLATSRLRPPPP